MKTTTKFLAFLMLALAPLFLVAAKPESAPGIQKKTLEIFNVSVATTATTATIFWETNVPSVGSVFLDDYGIMDDKTGTRHSVTIPYLAAGQVHEYTVFSYSNMYGSAAPQVGTFSL